MWLYIIHVNVMQELGKMNLDEYSYVIDAEYNDLDSKLMERIYLCMRVCNCKQGPIAFYYFIDSWDSRIYISNPGFQKTA